MIQLQVLGRLDLRDAEGQSLRAVLQQPRRAALLVHLAAAPAGTFHRRDRLLAMFWPEADDTHARNSLNSAIRFLRRALGDDIILSRGAEELGVDAARVECDAARFEAAVAEGDAAHAVEIYRGDLLAGFHIADAPTFDEWVESERRRLRGLVTAATARLSGDACRLGDHEDAVRWARRAAELAPDDERMIRLLIDRLDGAGDRVGALNAYDAFATRMRAEYEAEPAPETQALIERVRARVETSGQGVIPPLRHSDAPELDDANDVATPAPRPERAPHAVRGGSTRWRLAAIATAMLVGISALVRGVSLEREGPLPDDRRLTHSGGAVMGAISPDGQLLAYVEPGKDSNRVRVQDLLGGGEPRTIAVFREHVFSIDWSPDATRILVGGRWPADILPRLGGYSTGVGTWRDAQSHACWRPPEGKQVSLHAPSDKRIHIVDVASQDTVTLPVAGNYIFLLEGSWSPSGRTFAVITQSEHPVGWQIRTVSFDGGTEVIAEDSVIIGAPRWSPDGRALYYTRDGDAVWRVAVSPGTGWRLGAATLVIHDLELFPHSFGLVHFSLADSGRALVYARGGRYSNVWLVEPGAPGERPRTIPITTGTSRRWSPVVSPDGSSIVFGQETSTGGELFEVSIEGGSARQITTGARVMAEKQVAWSPDGRLIAFATLREGGLRVATARRADGRISIFDKTSMSMATGHLTWAPGTLIAYQRGGNRNVALLDPLTGVERDLAPDARRVHSPRYSPDGRTIAACKLGGDPPGVVVFDLERSTQRSALRQGCPYYPRGWSADGKFVYLQRTQAPTIFRLSITGTGQPEAVLEPPFREAQCNPVGASRPSAFVCAVFESPSDIWRIDNFDPHRR